MKGNPMTDLEILSNRFESLVVYDEANKKELVVITKDDIVISNSNLLVKLKPSHD